MKLKPGRDAPRDEPSESVYFQCNMNISDLLLGCLGNRNQAGVGSDRMRQLSEGNTRISANGLAFKAALNIINAALSFT